MGHIIGILTRTDVNSKGTPIQYCMESTRRAIVKAVELKNYNFCLGVQ